MTAYGVITKDSIAGPSGEPLDPRAWQRRLVRETFARDPATGRLRHRTALWGMARKNGKTGIVAPLAIAGLVLGGDGAEVYSCAADRAQAHLVFGAAKRNVELVPELAGRLRIYRDAIEDPVTGSVYRALSSEAYTKEGLSPTLVIADELHAWPSPDLYSVMALAMGARRDPLMLIVTTAGVRIDTTGGDSIAYSLFQYGSRVARGEVDDPTFYMAWWAAADGAPIGDRSSWADANPGLADILDETELAAAAAKAGAGGFSESEFRIKRLNQWVASAQAWLPSGVFESRATPGRRLQPGERCVLFLDGSFNHDATVLVACTLDGFIDVVGCWEKPEDDPRWEVPMAEVEAAAFAACRDYGVLEVAGDPFRWARELQAWESAGLPVSQYPTTSAPRMVPACAKFYDAVIDGRLTHSGDPRLVRHVANAVVKVDRLGPRIVREHRGSPRNIDLAVGGVGAYDRATFLAAEPAPKPRLGAILV